ncbi:MAG TPA: hypothetical protein VG603_08855, partial [Chitinophagales bacterium]|nr:hypothetical protein [Chitinophagales bacterium]
MKIFITHLLALVMAMTVSAQNEKVYMKDGKLLGEKKDLVAGCVTGMGGGKDSADKAAKEKICDCMITSIAANFTYKEFMKLVNSGDFDFTKLAKDKKKNAWVNDVIDCIKETPASINDTSTSDEVFRSSFVASCKE